LSAGGRPKHHSSLLLTRETLVICPHRVFASGNHQ
jgi:hypothetical protein